ncbi:MAG: glucose-phosphatase [Patescibacteria group bacterium]|nr:HAD family phosphatase [Candidatus Saccharibacteria bacterium]MDQ5963382.1 glucose-phosphatase [Patescibacteria group bacterium]
MIKAIVFDCFGVLVTDSLQLMVQDLAASNPSAAQEVRDLVGLSNRGIIDPAEARPKIAKLFGVTTEQYVQAILKGEDKNTQLLDYIRELRTTYKIGMLSNIGSNSLHKRFSDEELEEHFDIVVASGDIGYAKPDRQAYEIVAERLGVSVNECVFTDDREGFCEAARLCGMQAILFEDFTQFKRDLALLLELHKQ